MVTVEVRITKDTATPALRELREGLDPENLMPIFGRSVANAVQANFDDLESSRPNKLGGERQHYYSGARSATTFTTSGDTATVMIAQVGMRLRYYGGTVEAGRNVSSFTGQPTKYLTIPAQPDPAMIGRKYDVQRYAAHCLVYPPAAGLVSFAWGEARGDYGIKVVE